MIADDIGRDLGRIAAWFAQDQSQPYVLVRISEADAIDWRTSLGLGLRRCYVSDGVVNTSAAANHLPKKEIIAARLPDHGATMAGDFGEILVYIYQAAKAHPAVAIGPKKWGLKQDRTKPAPHSDVLHFVLPSWPGSSPHDLLLCSEVKTKSTNGASTPIKSAIEACAKDRTSRLTRTLMWLRERALFEQLEDIEVAQLDRFINATDHPAAIKRFSAVAVVCKSLAAEELSAAPTAASPEYSLIVIEVPDLYATYMAVFASALEAVPPPVAAGIVGPQGPR